MGQSVHSANSQLLQTSVAWLIQQKSAQPFRGTHRGWRHGKRKTSWSSTKENAKYCTWVQITPCTSTGWQLTGWKAVWQRRTLGSFQPTTHWPCASNAPSQQRRSTASWAALEKALPAHRGRWSLHSDMHWWDSWRAGSSSGLTSTR